MEWLFFLLWWISGSASFFYWWTTEYPFEREQYFLAFFAGIMGPSAFVTGYLIHGRGR